MVDDVRPAAVVFDFDGLLMDTETTSLESWRHEWSQWGLTLDEGAFFADHGGDVSAERYAELAEAAGPTYDQKLSHARRVDYRDRLHEDLELAAGIADWIAQGTSSGLRLAVASSSPRHWVTGHLERAGILDVFEILACGDEVADHKPAPDVYLLALDRLGITGDQAVAIEDTPHGVAAARTAGMRCIAIPNPFVDSARFVEAGLVLRSAAELPLDEALARLR